jgi:rhodanese-related sulfurtransferase
MNEPFKRISPDQAKELLARGDIDLIDVREPHEWMAGHLPGARHVPLGTFIRSPKEFLTKDNVIFVCAHGQRSATAATVAAQVGYKQLYNIEGGTVGWVRSGLPISREP